MPMLRASTIGSPRPEFTPFISAATITSQATPSASRSAVKIWGSAAGNTTRREEFEPAQPEVLGRAHVHEWDVAHGGHRAHHDREEGRQEDEEDRVQVPTPNHRMATGIHAMGEIGHRPWISGLTAWKLHVDQPAQRPSGIPTMTASEKPQATRKTLATA